MSKRKAAREAYERPAVTQQDIVSRDVEAKVREMLAAGRQAVPCTAEEMEAALRTFDERSHVSYVLKSGLYRCGGFIRVIAPAYLVLFQPCWSVSWSVSYANVRAFYVKPWRPKQEETPSKERDAKRTRADPDVDLKGAAPSGAKQACGAACGRA